MNGAIGGWNNDIDGLNVYISFSSPLHIYSNHPDPSIFYSDFLSQLHNHSQTKGIGDSGPSGQDVDVLLLSS